MLQNFGFNQNIDNKLKYFKSTATKVVAPSSLIINRYQANLQEFRYK